MQMNQAAKELVDVMLSGKPERESPYCVHSFIIGRCFERVTMLKKTTPEMNSKNLAVFLAAISEELERRGIFARRVQ